jgi:hypothetical protein
MKAHSVPGSQRRLPKEDIARRGDEIFAEIIQPRLTPTDHGKFVAIDVESGEFEIDRDEIAASDRLRSRRPDAQTWLMRVGYRSVRRYGGRRRGAQ